MKSVKRNEVVKTHKEKSPKANGKTQSEPFFQFQV
jgi:hypothetical protein